MIHVLTEKDFTYCVICDSQIHVVEKINWHTYKLTRISRVNNAKTTGLISSLDWEDFVYTCKEHQMESTCEKWMDELVIVDKAVDRAVDPV